MMYLQNNVKIYQMPYKRDFSFVFFTSFTAILSIILLCPEANASVISRIQTASKSVVVIRAESAGVTERKKGEDAHSSKAGKNIQLFHQSREGAGIILTGEGIIASNVHTVHGASRITAVLHSGQQLSATPVFAAPEHDLIFLKIHSEEALPAIALANSDALRLNETVYSIGTSHLLKNTLSEGKITGLGRFHSRPSKGKPKTAVIQINYSSYAGDSGSPVLNASGALLGITLAGRKDNNATFAVSSNLIALSLKEYLRSKDVPLESPET